MRRTRPERLQGWALDKQQLRFMLWRHRLSKRRGWVMTAVEVLSPVFIMLALVAGYHLSKIENWPEHSYAEDTRILVKNTTEAFFQAAQQNGVARCTAQLLGRIDLPPVDPAAIVAFGLSDFGAAGPGDPAEGFPLDGGGRHLHRSLSQAAGTGTNTSAAIAAAAQALAALLAQQQAAASASPGSSGSSSSTTTTTGSTSNDALLASLVGLLAGAGSSSGSRPGGGPAPGTAAANLASLLSGLVSSDGGGGSQAALLSALLGAAAGVKDGSSGNSLGGSDLLALLSSLLGAGGGGSIGLSNFDFDSILHELGFPPMSFNLTNLPNVTQLTPEQQRLAEGVVGAFADGAANAVRQPTFMTDLRKCAISAATVLPQTLVRLFSLFINIKGPLPAITFDEYVGIAKSIEFVLGDNDVDTALQLFKRDFGMNWLGNLVGLGKLAFVPASPEVLAFVDYMTKSHVYFSDVFMGVYTDVGELEAMARDGYRFWAVVVFDSGPSTATGADYTIRMALPETPATYIPIEKYEHWTSHRYKMYFTSGFFSIEAAINNYVLGNAPELEASLVVPRQPGSGLWNATAGSVPGPFEATQLQAYNIWFSAFPRPAFIFNKFYQAVGPMLGLLMCLSLLFPLAMLIRGIVDEKETKMREVLYIMGLRSWVLYASWLLTYLGVFTAVSVLTVAVTTSTFLANSSATLLLVFFMLFSISELSFGLMMSTLFSRAKVAAIVGPLMHFAFVMPRYMFFRTGSPQALAGKLCVSLLAPSAFTFGADLIATYEDAGGGLQWKNIWDDPYPFGGSMLMLMVDSCLYLLLALYLDKVVSSGYGASLPFYFPLQPSYWRRLSEQRKRTLAHQHAYRFPTSDAAIRGPAAAGGSIGLVEVFAGRRSSSQRHNGMHADEDAEDGSLLEASVQQSVEESSSIAQLRRPSLGVGGDVEAAVLNGGGGDEDVVVDMRGLHMRYPNGVVAVHNLSLQMRAGQITGLLGHNGAGKSTTVAMMTGLMMPTSGDALINRRSICHDTLEARRSLGICPQQNVLVDRMSVAEHLMLLAAIKGVLPADLPGAVEQMQATIGLPNDGHTLAVNLSGGMKRKLQVGMALIGGSKVVLLDEPTSGMDPTARRGLWALLRSVKDDRALLLTTHFMDEADILSDKVAILSAGRLCCCGSPMQLKAKYGDGYTLTVTKTAAAGFDTNALEAAVSAFVPGGQLVRSAAAEVVFRLPLDSTHMFVGLFDHLERSADQLGIAHYGVSMPSMEEVFLRATADSHGKDPTAASAMLPVRLSGTAATTVMKHASSVSAATNIGGASGNVNAPMNANNAAVGIPVGSNALLSSKLHATASSSGHALGLNGSSQMLLPSISSSAAAGNDHSSSSATHYAPLEEFDPLDPHGPKAQPAESVGGSGRVSTASSRVSGVNGSAGLSSGPGPVAESYEAISAHSNGDGVAHGDGSGGKASSSSGGMTGKARPATVGSVPPPAGFAHAWRCFKQMVIKRKIISMRDWKALLYLFLLPVVAVMLTLLILTVNVDPTGPSLILSLHSIEQFSPLPVANNPAPDVLNRCIAPVGIPDKVVKRTIYEGWVPKYHGVDNCPKGLGFLNLPIINDSVGMSDWLLGQVYTGAAPQYGAAVFDDPTVHNLLPYLQECWQNETKRATDDFFINTTVDLTQIAEYAITISGMPGGLQLAAATLANRIDNATADAILASIMSYGKAFLGRGDTETTTTAASPAEMHAGLGGRRRALLEADEVEDLTSAARRLAQAGGGDLMLKELIDKAGPIVVAALADPEVQQLLKTSAKIQRVASGLIARFEQPPVTLLFNASSFHSTMALLTDFQQALSNVNMTAVLGRSSQSVQALGDGVLRDDTLLRVTNHPLPLTKRDSEALDTFLTILAAIFVLVPFCYLSGAYAVSPVSEAASGSKAMQLGSGCPRMSYWAGSFAWDLATHLAVTILSVATFAAFDDKATSGSWDRAWATFLLILGYGAGVIPLSYCYSFGFSSPSTAQVSVSAINFVLGFMFVVGSQTMANIPESRDFQRVAVHFCRLLPPFNLGEGLISLSTYNLMAKVAEDLAQAKNSTNGGARPADQVIPADAFPQAINVPATPFAWEVVGRNLAALYGTTILYFLLAVAIDKLRTDARWQEVLSEKTRWLLGTATAPASALQGWLRDGRRRPYSTYFSAAVAEARLVAFGPTSAATAVSANTSRPGRALGDERSYEMEEGQLRLLDGGEDGGSSSSAVFDVRSHAHGLNARDAARLAVTGRRPSPAASAPGGLLQSVASAGSAVLGTNGSSLQGLEAVVVEEENADVAAERVRLETDGVLGTDAIVIRHLRKVYATKPPKVAVHDLCLGIGHGQRFGFLGANGAGKTTTLSILSGQAAATAGDAFVTGHSVSWQHDAAQHRIGYCPQVDPLLDHMSAREQLLMYAAIKGVAVAGLAAEADALLARVGLPPAMANRASGTLSGGNKRKVALAIALTGSPAAVLLDEPSSGMDPGARRLMWDAILRATQNEDGSGGRVALVLTTHYLEEAEALCERVGIMNKGRLACLGSPQHLKSTFGGCYALEIHAPEGVATTAAVSALVTTAFPGSRLDEAHFGLLKFQLPAEGLSLARVFQVLEASKAELGVSAYSVSQPSLEQVFLAVVGHALNPNVEDIAASVRDAA